MSVMIQIRNVPNELHRKLKSRAALAGMSLWEYLLREVGEVAERPTMAELWARIAGREPVYISESAADAVRAERDSR